MSCYTRHLDEYLPSFTNGRGKGKLGDAVRVYLGLEDADCQEVWAAVRELREEPASRTRSGRR